MASEPSPLPLTPAAAAAALTPAGRASHSDSESDSDTAALLRPHSSSAATSATSASAASPAARPSLWRLYVSHALTAWTMRMWEFAAALMLMAIRPRSLALPSANELTIGVFVALFSTSVGALVDRMHRLTAARASLLTSKIFFSAAALCVYVVLLHWGEPLPDQGPTATTSTTSTTTTTTAGSSGQQRPPENSVFWALVVAIMIFTALGHLGYTANKLSVEKSWVLAILQRNTAAITATNAVLRRIDLSCSLLAPMAAGFIMTYAGVKTGALAVAIWNSASTLPELYLLMRLYHAYPILKVRDAKDRQNGKHENPADPLTARPAASAKARVGICSSLAQPFVELYRGWRDYSHQITLRPGLALALLYASLLGMGPVMTAYAYSRGMREATLGGLRGVGAVFGIAATFCSSFFQRRIGLARTALLATWSQLLCLTMALASAMVAEPWLGDCGGSPKGSAEYEYCAYSRRRELVLLMTGVILSRTGLWLFDLTVSQMLQQWYVSAPVFVVAACWWSFWLTLVLKWQSLYCLFCAAIVCRKSGWPVSMVCRMRCSKS